jgi:hypothetical protein
MSANLAETEKELFEARSLRALGCFNDAQDCLERALSCKPLAIEILIEKAHLLTIQGYHNSSRALLEPVLYHNVANLNREELVVTQLQSAVAEIETDGKLMDARQFTMAILAKS